MIDAVQTRMGRAALRWGVRDLAKAAKVSPNTIARLERGEWLSVHTLYEIEKAMVDAGLQFLARQGQVAVVAPAAPPAVKQTSDPAGAGQPSAAAHRTMSEPGDS